jgi:flagellar basal body-associated protein FliL
MDATSQFPKKKNKIIIIIIIIIMIIIINTCMLKRVKLCLKPQDMNQ